MVDLNTVIVVCLVLNAIAFFIGRYTSKKTNAIDFILGAAVEREYSGELFIQDSIMETAKRMPLPDDLKRRR